MPSPEALPAPRYGLLNGHLGVTETDGLGLAALARPDTELLGCAGGPDGTIAG